MRSNEDIKAHIKSQRSLYNKASRYLSGYDGADYHPVAEVERQMDKLEGRDHYEHRYNALKEIILDKFSRDEVELISVRMLELGEVL